MSETGSFGVLFCAVLKDLCFGLPDLSGAALKDLCLKLGVLKFFLVSFEGSVSGVFSCAVLNRLTVLEFSLEWFLRICVSD